MALNCIVDDSALLAGLGPVAKSVNLNNWVKDGFINLFVPLYTLERLTEIKSSGKPARATTAAATLNWLDKATDLTRKSNAIGAVELQGPEDRYATWREVEKWMLPDTPLSRNNLDDLTHQLEDGLGLNSGEANPVRDASESGQSLSPMPSPDMTEAALVDVNGVNGAAESKTASKRSDNSNGEASTAIAQENVRSLLNFVVWRTHNTDAGSGKYILLTNDSRTQSLAQKFGVRAKSLAELQKIVRKAYAERGVDPQSPLVTAEDEKETSEDDEEVVFDAARRPGSSRGKSQPVNVMDPNHFGRRAPLPPVQATPTSNGHVTPRPSPRGQGHVRGASNGRGGIGSPRGRAGHYFRGGTRGGAPGRGQSTQQPIATTKPIDPDSYARPISTRGRGGSKRLFDPHG